MGGGSAVERDTVLVLGAGASYGARLAARLQPPRGYELAEYLLRWLAANDPSKRDENWSRWLDGDEADPDDGMWARYDELRALLERARDLKGPDGFECIMAELADKSAVDLLNEVNAVVAVSFLGGEGCAFEEGVDLYDRLFQALGERLRGIVTPNYDILAEEALERVGLAYHYVGVGGDGDGVAIYKIHGSANLALPIGAAGGATPEIAQRNARPLRAAEQEPFPSLYPDRPLYAIDGRRNALIHFNSHHHHAQYHVLVTYGPQKPLVYGLPQIQKVRAQCLSDLRERPPARVIAAGIRPPFQDASGVDDPTWTDLCELFGRTQTAKTYWSGQSDERDSMTRFGFVGRDGWFQEFVENLERDLPILLLDGVAMLTPWRASRRRRGGRSTSSLTRA
jgi:hypothetical protein